MSDKAQETVLLPLLACWSKPLQDIAASLRRLVRARDLVPHDLAAVAKLIYGIDRLPCVTTGIGITATASISHAGGRGWLEIRHFGDSLAICFGESSFEQQGCETEVREVLNAESGGGHGREREDPIVVMCELEDWASQWTQRVLDPSNPFEIIDEGIDLDWQQACPQNAWELVPDGT